MTKKQEADYIQSLSEAQLKVLEADGQWVEMDLSEEPIVKNMTKEQQANYFQSLSVKELKELSAKVKWEKVIMSEVSDYDDDDDSIHVHEIQNYAVAEPQTPYGMEAKMQKTGLTKTQILTIEKNKTQATLSEIMLYCKGLDIPYAQILPELYVG